MEMLWEVVGWTGAAAMLGAFMSVSMGWLKPGISFQAVNLFGACAFILNGLLHGAWPSVVTNIAWFLISSIAILRMRAKQRAVAETVAPTAEVREFTTTDTGTHVVVPVAKCA
ncbi:hypothetical protein ACIPY3_08920 [Paenarthrobacter sp. NPDC089714]|uniref:CBU_0592 family membrane protein n=1 Tax=unclassified Paenarthrobacter TaxID=2634190 RepID=UPI0037FFEA44